VVFDVPLLADRGSRWRAAPHRVLVVDCSETTQMRPRDGRSSGWTETAGASGDRPAGAPAGAARWPTR
jgi:dephospho-CoA kinase